MIIINYSNFIQTAITSPTKKNLRDLVEISMQKNYNMIVINIEIITRSYMTMLNKQYRGKNRPTNIISLEYPSENKYLTGDIFLCHDVIKIEAKFQQKKILDHYFHLILHGLLHLQGFDHIKESDAQEMESLEVLMLKKMGIQNPYLTNINRSK